MHSQRAMKSHLWLQSSIPRTWLLLSSYNRCTDFISGTARSEASMAPTRVQVDFIFLASVSRSNKTPPTPPAPSALARLVHSSSTYILRLSTFEDMFQGFKSFKVLK